VWFRGQGLCLWDVCCAAVIKQLNAKLLAYETVCG